MKQLSKEAFASAVTWLERQGRKIDLAWYRHEFEGGTKDAVFKELRTYQCGNGGFGHALEPDHRTTLPSCLETCIAFRWFTENGLTESDTMLKRAMAFLGKNYDAGLQRWPAFPKEANSDPHAIWWHFAEGEDLTEAEKMWGLPSAEILGIMLRYDPDNKRWQQCFQKAVQRLDEIYPDMEMNEASSFIRMYGYLEAGRKKQIYPQLAGVLEKIVETDENKWSEYCAKPLMYISSPDSDFYGLFREAVERNIDWEINCRTAEGCWTPTWQWWRDEQHWPAAREECKSMLTAETLVLLKRFGRLAWK
ncbi:MAG: hypothetical protein JW874_09910 [Spirochaetales bacterium]|nr:hypothetical protein [Spirochaetales bacterium]